jgi:hypothetical protein
MSIEHEDDYDTTDSDVESVDIDETETVSPDVAGTDAAEDSGNLTDADLAEAESLTVTAKQSIRQQLEDEVARFLAQGGRITEVPADDGSHD